MGPCFQTGVLSYTLDGTEGTQSPTEFCSTSTDAATVELPKPIGAGDSLTVSSNDNRAFGPEEAELSAAPNPEGGLVRLTVPVGEPGAVAGFQSELPGFRPSGFPTCTANLDQQSVACSGLAEGESYTIADGAQSVTAISEAEEGVASHGLTIRGGDAISLSNGARTLTTLHVADLRVNINGYSAKVASGTCSPEEYWGRPLPIAPTSLEAGMPTQIAGGSDLTGRICPASGEATGLPTGEIAETDELSGGTTVTEVATLANTSPMEGETTYGAFTALAEASDGVAPIAVSVAPAGGGAPVFTATNVDTSGGASVGALAPGTYRATWTASNPQRRHPHVHDTLYRAGRPPGRAGSRKANRVRKASRVPKVNRVLPAQRRRSRASCGVSITERSRAGSASRRARPSRGRCA